MAKKAAKRKARGTSSVLIQELRKLANVLDTSGLCPDVSPLQGGIREWKNAYSNGWHYSIENLLFHRVPSAKCLPSNLIELTCRLSADVQGYFDPAPAADPLRHVSLEITLEALGSNKERLIHSWHFDRHVGDPKKAPGETEAAHPRYHFHFGGNRMRAFAAQNQLQWFPHVLLLEGPRPAHPPLDGVLAIDFLLSNFFASAWRRLRETTDYVQVIASAQRRLWKPYADVLPTHWNFDGGPDADSRWAPMDCWPHLVKAASA